MSEPATIAATLPYSCTPTDSPEGKFFNCNRSAYARFQDMFCRLTCPTVTPPHKAAVNVDENGDQSFPEDDFEAIHLACTHRRALLRCLDKSKTLAVGMLVIFTKGEGATMQLGTALVSLFDWHVVRIRHFVVEGVDTSLIAPFEYGETVAVKSPAALGSKLAHEICEAEVAFQEVIVGGHDLTTTQVNLSRAQAFPWPSLDFKQADALHFWRAIFERGSGGAITDALEPFGYNYPKSWFENPAHVCLASADVMRLGLTVWFKRRKEAFPVSVSPRPPRTGILAPGEQWKDRREFTHEGVKMMELRERVKASLKALRDLNLQGRQGEASAFVFGKRTSDGMEEV